MHPCLRVRRSHLLFALVIHGERGRLAEIADGHDGANQVVVRDLQQATCDFVIEAGHLVRMESEGGGLIADGGIGRAKVVHGVFVWSAFGREGLFGCPQQEDRSAASPGAVPLAERLEDFGVRVGPAAADEISPRLLVIRRGGPPGGFKQRAGILRADIAIGEGARTPAVEDEGRTTGTAGARLICSTC